MRPSRLPALSGILLALACGGAAAQGIRNAPPPRALETAAYVFAAANVFFRDFSNVVHILINFVRFGVPMIYPYSIVHERFGAAAQFYLFNPIADAVLLVQRCFWVGSTDHPATTMRDHIPHDLFAYGFLALGISLVLLGIGQWVFSSLNKKIPERLNA